MTTPVLSFNSIPAESQAQPNAPAKEGYETFLKLLRSRVSQTHGLCLSSRLQQSDIGGLFALFARLREICTDLPLWEALLLENATADSLRSIQVAGNVATALHALTADEPGPEGAVTDAALSYANLVSTLTLETFHARFQIIITKLREAYATVDMISDSEGSNGNSSQVTTDRNGVRDGDQEPRQDPILSRYTMFLSCHDVLLAQASMLAWILRGCATASYLAWDRENGNVPDWLPTFSLDSRCLTELTLEVQAQLHKITRVTRALMAGVLLVRDEEESARFDTNQQAQIKDLQIEKLTQLLGEARDDLARLKTKYDSQLQQHRELVSKQQQFYSTHIAQLEAQLEREWTTKLNQKTSQLTLMHQSEMQRTLSELGKVRGELQTTLTELSKSQKDLVDCQTRELQTRSQIEALQAELSQLRQQLSLARTRISEQDAQLVELQSNVSRQLESSAPMQELQTEQQPDSSSPQAVTQTTTVSCEQAAPMNPVINAPPEEVSGIQASNQRHDASLDEAELLIQLLASEDAEEARTGPSLTAITARRSDRATPSDQTTKPHLPFSSDPVKDNEAEKTPQLKDSLVSTTPQPLAAEVRPAPATVSKPIFLPRRPSPQHIRRMVQTQPSPQLNTQSVVSEPETPRPTTPTASVRTVPPPPKSPPQSVARPEGPAVINVPRRDSRSRRSTTSPVDDPVRVCVRLVGGEQQFHKLARDAALPPEKYAELLTQFSKAVEKADTRNVSPQPPSVKPLMPTATSERRDEASIRFSPIALPSAQDSSLPTASLPASVPIAMPIPVVPLPMPVPQTLANYDQVQPDDKVVSGPVEKRGAVQAVYYPNIALATISPQRPMVANYASVDSAPTAVPGGQSSIVDPNINLSQLLLQAAGLSYVPIHTPVVHGAGLASPRVTNPAPAWDLERGPPVRRSAVPSDTSGAVRPAAKSSTTTVRPPTPTSARTDPSRPVIAFGSTFRPRSATPTRGKSPLPQRLSTPITSSASFRQ